MLCVFINQAVIGLSMPRRVCWTDSAAALVGCHGSKFVVVAVFHVHYYTSELLKSVVCRGSNLDLA